MLAGKVLGLSACVLGECRRSGPDLRWRCSAVVMIHESLSMLPCVLWQTALQ